MNDAEIEATVREAVSRFNARDFARAEQLYRKVVAAAPRSVYYADLGAICAAAGRFDDAVAMLRKAVELDARAAEPHYKLGNIHRDRGEIEDAVRCYHDAISLDPAHADALSNLGFALTRLARPDEAEQHLRAAIAVSPRHDYALNNLGTALHKQGRIEEAIDCYRRAIALSPGNAQAHANLGSAYQVLDRLEEAIQATRRAVELDPSAAWLRANLGNIYADALRLDEAIASFDQAIAIAPLDADHHWGIATRLLLKGNYPRGWKEYEWRWQGCPELIGGKPRFPQPEWQGGEIADKTILIHREQGAGDVIQFARYAPLLAEQGAKVVLAVPPDLVRLLRSILGIQVTSDEEPLPPFDVHCALLSLPLLFGTTASTIPCRVPYLAADVGLAAEWRRRFQAPGFRVGLIWGGAANNRTDRKRSIPLSEFAPLGGIPGIEFYSLQLGEHAAQAKIPPAGLTLTDWTADIHDFADTAALMDNLNLIITVDTAGAHLAGALGKPVWLLNRYESEWRWLLNRSDSPWYPTMRIFRQPRPGDWKSVIAEVTDALRDELG